MFMSVETFGGTSLPNLDDFGSFSVKRENKLRTYSHVNFTVSWRIYRTTAHARELNVRSLRQRRQIHAENQFPLTSPANLPKLWSAHAARVG